MLFLSHSLISQWREKDNSGMIHPVIHCRMIRRLAKASFSDSNKTRTHKLRYYAIDFCLLSFNDQPLASSQDLHPVEIALRWWLTQVGRCLILNPMFPRWTRQQLLGNALTGQKGKANTQKGRFLFSLHRQLRLDDISEGRNKIWSSSKPKSEQMVKNRSNRSIQRTHSWNTWMQIFVETPSHTHTDTLWILKPSRGVHTNQNSFFFGFV